ncbi:DUF4190 domain-containing protein [Clostridium rectalis]|uniref:DUF4190 domain-containing protein n=1 Tax=Clostridium rectalis TaxID=2040295 RepID=UPI0019D1B391|nr:DUF4190 domain-containing protein [Clostridium rectalis]
MESNNLCNNQKRTDGMAIASLVCGIVGLVFLFMPIVYGLGIIPAILAIVFGNISKGKIRKDPNLDGYGMAKAGFICGVVGVVLVVISLIGCGLLVGSLLES